MLAHNKDTSPRVMTVMLTIQELQHTNLMDMNRKICMPTKPQLKVNQKEVKVKPGTHRTTLINIRGPDM